MANKMKEHPRYNVLSTRLADETMTLLQAFADTQGVNKCQAAEALIQAGLRMVSHGK